MKSVQGMPSTLALSCMLIVCTAAAASAEDTVTQGALLYTVPDSTEQHELPLEHTDVQVAVSGTVAEVTVTQTFSNPLPDRLEAVYVFPLPDRAASRWVNAASAVRFTAARRRARSTSRRGPRAASPACSTRSDPTSSPSGWPTSCPAKPSRWSSIM